MHVNYMSFLDDQIHCQKLTEESMNSILFKHSSCVLFLRVYIYSNEDILKLSKGIISQSFSRQYTMKLSLFDVLVVLLTLFEFNRRVNALFTRGTCPACPRLAFQNMLLILPNCTVNLIRIS